MKKVSVIIPAYNKADLTVKTVESVLKQTYQNIEIIVIDDGSCDHTKKALTGFGDRIRYVCKPNGGACGARNMGIKISTGDYVAFLDCDDLYEPNKIELSVNYLERNPHFGFVHTSSYFINEEDKIVGYYSHQKSKKQGWIAQRLILGNFVCNSTVVVRQSCLVKAGFFDETIFTPADWDLWMRLAEIAQVGFINLPLTLYRITDNYVFNRLEQAQREEEIVIEKFFNRNPTLGMSLWKMASSNLHLRYSECYFLKNNYPLLKKEFISAMSINPLNFKAIVLLVYFLLSRRGLKSLLSKKILRGAQVPI